MNKLGLKGLDIGQTAAIYAALRSSIYSFKTGAALVKKGKVIEIGWSHVGPIKWIKTPWSTHAEAHAIRRAGFKTEGCDLYIATLNKRGTKLTCSHPCDVCLEFLSSLNLNKIVFINSDGSWNELKIS